MAKTIFIMNQQLINQKEVLLPWQRQAQSRFEEGYKKYLWNSYNKYSHEDTEIIIEVTPQFVEIWDTNDDEIAYQIFIDFKKKSIEYKPYDVE